MQADAAPTKPGDFWHYYRPVASVVLRNAILASMDEMLATFSEANRTRFSDNFGAPMAKQAKVASWRDLPMEKLSGLHDLLARTPPDAETPHAE